MWKFGIILSVLLALAFTASSTTKPVDVSKSFEGHLMSAFGAGVIPDNILYSPVSIKTVLTVLSMFAQERTDAELRRFLGYENSTKITIADDFKRFNRRQELTALPNGTVFRLATAIYIDRSYEIDKHFCNLIAKRFLADIRNIDSSNAEGTAKIIHDFIKGTTQMIDVNPLRQYNTAILRNAIYFKGAWENSFRMVINGTFTSITGSHQNNTFIYTEGAFNYGVLPHLKAKALEIKFRNSHLSMLLILPDELHGIKDLEKKLETIDLNDICHELTITQTKVAIPKFEISHEVDLVKAVKMLNIENVLGVDASYPNFFRRPQTIEISEARHNAYIDVSEYGVLADPVPAPARPTKQAKVKFTANRPFIFFVRNIRRTFLVGRFVSFNN